MNAQAEIDEFYLRKSLNLAKKAEGKTFPNPLVGCVIVKNNKIIGKGFHKKAGDNHAEINALNNSEQSVNGATLYVNLEPCSHFGKTPPCVESIIKAGISRVVFCTLDPNTKVHGKGKQKLIDSGVEVTFGILEHAAEQLNESYFVYQTLRRPFIAIKYASSIDGKITTSTGESKWITNSLARQYGRKLRSKYQAILVGSNTVLHDNPHLGSRISGNYEPIRIILDSSLKTDPSSKVYRDSNVLVFTSQKVTIKRRELFKKHNIETIFSKSNEVLISEVLEHLYIRNIISIYVEGGSKVLGSFNDLKTIDRLYAFVSPIIIGGDGSKSPISGEGVDVLKNSLHLEQVETKYFEDNILITGRIKSTTSF